ncbi:MULTISPECIES: 2-amino-4-hydroxy-6-hydroxymethyldihydropteridine diphosphokinase [Pedobacter]|uniref:2-amino-4-hydroxy-6-hydroxymethyldihydropteridine pyrophosphokinase n=1 Tax=Pedobacter zeae TaxID=1737356 RepID=A0A7W6KAZ0_9SPHI|nr:2-amino-4-hydroxy-6-hydroxymethyldihydropteridine diphosphokinase [Pedobacter zeae]MBB4108312.1 2-amino-4-hydroxy-6-hydroxymethyldihydropteridine diphosphokinase [Pedobacter zeae]GGG93609.1 2-amino-4-hydroxy-6-hydroxymethyldihydropteridine diphosphokinase [Pedobacter zeae]
MMLNKALECNTVYLLLGGNLGSREENLKRAIALLDEKIGKVISVSSLYETAAWGKTDQPAFLNQAVALQTNLSALEVLDRALSIEGELGRIRKDKWGERLIDIDLILFGNEIIHVPDKLQVPHPHMQNRKFVMEPLAEIAPDVVHPVLGETILSIFLHIKDPLEVKKL